MEQKHLSYNKVVEGGEGAGVILLDMADPAAPRVLMLHNRRGGVWSFVKGSYQPATDRGYSLLTAVRKMEEITGLKCNKDYEIVGRSIHYGRRLYWIGIMKPEGTRPGFAPLVHKYISARWMTFDGIQRTNMSADVRKWTTKGLSPNGLFLKTLTSWKQSKLSTH